MNRKSNTILWAVIACILWSTIYPAVKIGLNYVPPFHFAGIRFIISGIMILPFTVKLPDYFRMICRYWKVVILVTLLQTIINYSLFYHGMDLVPGALGAVIVGSQPLITALVAASMLKGEKLTINKVLTITAGLTGVILISAGRQALRIGTAAELLGVIMILGSNIATSTSNVIVSAKSKGLNPLVLSSFSFFTGGIIISMMSLVFEKQPQLSLPAEYWIILLWLSFTSAFAFSVWYILIQRPEVKVSELNLWKFIIPVLGAILSWTFVKGENPDILTIIGIIIITGSLILFFRARNGRSNVKRY